MAAWVSVLIPAYRAEDVLARAVRSALAGGIPEDRLELLVESDDGQDYAAVAALSSAVRVARGGVKSGVGPARNRALARASGAFVTYLDADDHLAPGALADLMRVAEGAGAAAMPLVVAEGDTPILRLWQDQPHLGFADLAESGASLRVMVARDRCAPFADALSQDILHGLRLMAQQGGILPLSRIPWHLNVTPGSVTGADDFAARVDLAYQAHIAALEADPDLPPVFALAAADVFRAKRALNADFIRAGQGRSYYRFIADRLAG